MVVSNLQAEITQAGQEVTYKPEGQRLMMIVPVGRSTGTGKYGDSAVWGCLVSYFRGRDYLTSKAPSFVEGRG